MTQKYILATVYLNNIHIPSGNSILSGGWDLCRHFDIQHFLCMLFVDFYGVLYIMYIQ
jgi:hypothetical protein